MRWEVNIKVFSCWKIQLSSPKSSPDRHKYSLSVCWYFVSLCQLGNKDNFVAKSFPYHDWITTLLLTEYVLWIFSQGTLIEWEATWTISIFFFIRKTNPFVTIIHMLFCPSNSCLLVTLFQWRLTSKFLIFNEFNFG